MGRHLSLELSILFQKTGASRPGTPVTTTAKESVTIRGCGEALAPVRGPGMIPNGREDKNNKVMLRRKVINLFLITWIARRRRTGACRSVEMRGGHEPFRIDFCEWRGAKMSILDLMVVGVYWLDRLYGFNVIVPSMVIKRMIDFHDF